MADETDKLDRSKRYILFAGDQYYPGGGMEDFRGTFDTVEEARAAAGRGRSRYDWAQVVDRETLTDVTAAARGRG